MNLTTLLCGWIFLAILGIANGILRETLLRRWFGARSLPLSGLTLCSAIVIAILVMNPAQGLASGQALGVGLIWVAMTIIFECVFGRKQGKTWMEICRAYTLHDGNLWSVVLLVIAVTPWIASRVEEVLAVFTRVLA